MFKKKLIELYFSSNKKSFDDKFKDIECYLKNKTFCGSSNTNNLTFKIRNFKHQFKTKWTRSNRTKQIFLSNEKNWLNEIKIFKKYRPPVGRPSLDFESSCLQTKRKRSMYTFYLYYLHKIQHEKNYITFFCLLNICENKKIQWYLKFCLHYIYLHL